MKVVLLILSFLILGSCGLFQKSTSDSESGLTVFEENPRYFAYNGKPVFLASKSFGWRGVSDPDFNYVKDIETMADYGGNLLRLTLFWPGHGEAGGELPWIRNTETGRYNLDEFNPAYFKRLHHYLSVAQENAAVVNLELFDHPAVKGGPSRWPMHPMNPVNNINYGEEVFDSSSASDDFFQTLPENEDNPLALKYQRALVRKIIDETHEFNNIIYSLGNECPSPVEWNEYWTAFIREYAADRYAANVLVTNMWKHDLEVFDVFDVQSAGGDFEVRRASAAEMWVAWRHIHTRQQEKNNVKPVYDSGQMGGAPGSDILHQLWLSFAGGSAGMRYHRKAPVHPQPGVSSVLEVGEWEDPLYLQQQRWIQNLRQFIRGIRFWTMVPLWDAVAEGQGYVFSRPGEEYVIYLPEGGSVTMAEPLEAGSWEQNWYNPDTGEFGESWSMQVGTDEEPVTYTAPSRHDWVLHAVKNDS